MNWAEARTVQGCLFQHHGEVLCVSAAPCLLRTQVTNKRWMKIVNIVSPGLYRKSVIVIACEDGV